MIWSLYATLGFNMWYTELPTVPFEDEAWEILVDKAIENGFNQIVLDLGEGVRYGSHPELAHPGAWTRERVREEVKALRERGIELIPKLNFSAGHDMWLGDYGKMIGLPKYYEVCRDLITEVYNLFDKPRYIHIGMDEEDDPQFFEQMELITFRRGELLWHDLQYLCDCVRDMGATPWIWADIYWCYPEEFKKRVKAGDILLSPWYYRGLARENFTPLSSNPVYFEKFTSGKYKEFNLQYVEDDPFHESKFRERFIRTSIPAAEAGYDIIPCASIYFGNTKNPDEIVQYFIQNAPTDRLAGFMVAPWLSTEMKNIDEIVKNMEMLKFARDKFCK